MKELEEPEALVELHQRSHRGVAKRTVRCRGEVEQLIRRKSVAGEKGNETGGKFGIRPAGNAGQIVGQVR